MNIIFSKEVWSLFEKQEHSKHKNNLSKFLNKKKKNYLETSRIKKTKKNITVKVIIITDNSLNFF